MAFGADIIAGFPTETDEMFENTLNIVQDCDLTFLHVFPYSEREGTPAARIPNQVAIPVRKARAAKLRGLEAGQMHKFLQRHVGKTIEVVVEQNGRGRSPHFAEVTLDKALEAGTLARVQVTGIHEQFLTGTIIA
jgi:threonylcarbamoyladenosine tRNA methylthiotransferase MtaB